MQTGIKIQINFLATCERLKRDKSRIRLDFSDNLNDFSIDSKIAQMGSVVLEITRT